VKLVVGLGNPGPKYAKNRHNLGFMVIARFAEQHGAPAPRERFAGAFSKLQVGEQDVGLLTPHTYMNLSGRSVQQALHFFKLDVRELVVVHDELDLPFGVLRLKDGGGTAGHRGLSSIVEHCGDTGFFRLRLGIGRPPSGPVEAYVLSDFSGQESRELPDVLERATSALTDLLVQGAQAAMNAHNRAS
jgi:PTH1 family peptidyl-tRNA hydrolase